MIRALTILALLLAACSSPVQGPADARGTSHDSGSDVAAPNPDAGSDAASEGGDGGDGGDSGLVPDLDLGGVDAGPEACASLAPAPCMAREDCVLDSNCIEATGDEQPFNLLASGDWEGIAESTGDKTFPSGETAARMTLFRGNGRDLRGVLILPDHGVRHTVWGGVGPTGDLGIYLSPPQCSDPVLCDAPFSAAYAAGGTAGDLTLDVDGVETVDPAIDFRTFTSLRLTPSDGFKPVGPTMTRVDPVAGRWMGDISAVNAAGEHLTLLCDFIVNPDPDRSFPEFACSDPDGTDDVPRPVPSPDLRSLAWANGLGWFALGTDADALLFVGRVGVDGPWKGVVARRGDVWTTGDPIDPDEVPLEALRGTFQFYGFVVE